MADSNEPRYANELDLIEQLQADDQPLVWVFDFLASKGGFEKIMGQYVSKGVLQITDRRAAERNPIPMWRVAELLRAPERWLDDERADPNLVVSLTDAGATAFESGNWDKS